MRSDSLRWRKSSYSGGQGGNCVEVGQAANMILVRDTNDYGHGPVHRFSAAGWHAFVSSVHSGEFDTNEPGHPRLTTIPAAASQPRLPGGRAHA
jgi:hypothetical protein